MPTHTKKTRKNVRKTNVRSIARMEAKRVLSREVEAKYTDFGVSSQSISANPGYFAELTSNLVKGTATENEYIGTKITPKYLQIRGTIMPGDTANYVRLFLIQSKAANTPTVSSIWDTYGTITAPFAFLNRDYTSTYRLLASRLIKVVDSSEIEVRPFVISVPAKKMSQVHFLTGSNAVSFGPIWLCAVSDSTAAAHPNITFFSRLTYSDA